MFGQYDEVAYATETLDLLAPNRLLSQNTLTLIWEFRVVRNLISVADYNDSVCRTARPLIESFGLSSGMP